MARSYEDETLPNVPGDFASFLTDEDDDEYRFIKSQDYTPVGAVKTLTDRTFEKFDEGLNEAQRKREGQEQLRSFGLDKGIDLTQLGASQLGASQLGTGAGEFPKLPEDEPDKYPPGMSGQLPGTPDTLEERAARSHQVTLGENTYHLEADKKPYSRPSWLDPLKEAIAEGPMGPPEPVEPRWLDPFDTSPMPGANIGQEQGPDVIEGPTSPQGQPQEPSVPSNQQQPAEALDDGPMGPPEPAEPQGSIAERMSALDDQIAKAKEKGFATNEVLKLQDQRQQLYLEQEVESGRLEKYTDSRGNTRYRNRQEPTTETGEAPPADGETRSADGKTYRYSEEAGTWIEEGSEESALPQTPDQEYRRRVEERRQREGEFWEGQREKERTRPERERQQIARNREERLQRGQDYQQGVQDRIRARREGFETRRDMREQGRQRRSELREWQRTAREAQRQGQPIPPMPGAQMSQAPQTGGGTWQQPGFDAEGNFSVPFVDPVTGQSSSIGVVEDPGAPGTFIPRPGTDMKTLSQNAFNPDMQTSMDHLLEIGRQSGIQSSVFDRFEKVANAAKNINNAPLIGEKQRQKTRAGIQKEWAGLASQLIEMSPQLLRGRKAQEAERERDFDTHFNDVLGRFNSLRKANERSDYPRPESMLWQQAMAEVEREQMLRRAMEMQFNNELTQADAARFAVEAFPAPRRRPGQQRGISGPGHQSDPAQAGIQAPYGMTTTADPDLLWDLSDSIRNEYQNLPYTVSSDDKTGQLIIASGEFGSYPGAIVEGYDLPVAISHSESDERRLVQAGIPFIRTKDPFTVIDNHATQQITPTIETEEFPLGKKTDEVTTRLEEMYDTAFKKGREYDIASAEYDRKTREASVAREAAIDEAIDERTHSNIQRHLIKSHEGLRGTFLDPAEDVGDAPQQPDQELMAIYQRIKDARNESLQRGFESEFEKLTQASTNGYLLPDAYEKKRNELLESHRQAQAAPLEESDFMSAITQEEIANEVALERQKWEYRQEQKRKILSKAENDYSDEYRNTYNRRTVNGQISYTVADYDRNGMFTPRSLPVVNQGTRGAEMPVVRSPEDVASIGFDAPVLIRTRDGEMQQVTFESNVFKPAIEQAIIAGRRMDSGFRKFEAINANTDAERKIEIDKPEEAIVALGRLVDSKYPGRLSSAEAKTIAEQLMRRYGFMHTQEQLGY